VTCHQARRQLSSPRTHILALYRRNFRNPDHKSILQCRQENPDLQRLERHQGAAGQNELKAIEAAVKVGPRNNLDHDCVMHCDSIQTIPRAHLLAPVGLLLPDQEEDLARAIRASFDLD
jgi:mRNA-degrading endonuclease toxin of MazEF toxin-antitoxin module